jgi:hypothetical protein
VRYEEKNCVRQAFPANLSPAFYVTVIEQIQIGKTYSFNVLYVIMMGDERSKTHSRFLGLLMLSYRWVMANVIRSSGREKR